MADSHQDDTNRIKDTCNTCCKVARVLLQLSRSFVQMNPAHSAVPVRSSTTSTQTNIRKPSDKPEKTHTTTTGQCTPKRGLSASGQTNPIFSMATRLFSWNNRHSIRKRPVNTRAGDANNVTTHSPTVILASATVHPLTERIY